MFILLITFSIICVYFCLVVEDCGDIGEHNKMTIALEKIKSLASSHPINSSTFDLGMRVDIYLFIQELKYLFILYS